MLFIFITEPIKNPLVIIKVTTTVQIILEVVLTSRIISAIFAIIMPGKYSNIGTVPKRVRIENNIYTPNVGNIASR